MVNAAIIGLGWWGKVLVNAVQGKSDAIRFTHGATRTKANGETFAGEQGFALLDSYEAVLARPDIDAVVLATPHSQHRRQIEAAAAAGKHVFCEKPLTLTAGDTEAALAACESAGVVCATGFNRRFHPAIVEMRARLARGDLDTLLHCEGTMCSPNSLFLPSDSWRADKRETPAGGLTPMGVHMIDTFIDLFGDIDEVYCQSFRRAVPNDTDDTTSILFRFKNGMSGYLSTLMATQRGYRFQAFGTGGWIEIRNADMGRFEFVPRGGPHRGGPVDAETEVLDFSGFDMVRANLEAFAAACRGTAPYPVPPHDVVHGCAVIEAVVESAASHRPVAVG